MSLHAGLVTPGLPLASTSAALTLRSARFHAHKQRSSMELTGGCGLTFHIMSADLLETFHPVTCASLPCLPHNPSWIASVQNHQHQVCVWVRVSPGVRSHRQHAIHKRVASPTPARVTARPCRNVLGDLCHKSHDTLVCVMVLLHRVLTCVSTVVRSMPAL